MASTEKLRATSFAFRTHASVLEMTKHLLTKNGLPHCRLCVKLVYDSCQRGCHNMLTHLSISLFFGRLLPTKNKVWSLSLFTSLSPIAERVYFVHVCMNSVEDIIWTTIMHSMFNNNFQELLADNNCQMIFGWSELPQSGMKVGNRFENYRHFINGSNICLLGQQSVVW